MKGKASGRDPFAGYTPVKVSVPVVDQPESPAERPRGRKYRFSKGKESGDLSRTARLVLILIASAALLLAVAAFSFGVIYDKPVRQVDPELADMADDIRPLVDAGRSVRRRVVGFVSEAFPSGGGGQRADKSDDGRAQKSESAKTNVLSSVASGVVRVSEHKERVRCAEKLADGSGNPAETASAVDGEASSGDGDGGENAATAKPARLTPTGTGAKDDPPRRNVDPRLKEFYNGGRKGRSMGDWRRRK